MKLSLNLRMDMSKQTKTFIIMLIMAVLVPMALQAMSGAAYAEEEGAHHGTTLSQWFWLVVNFLILVGVLGFFLKKPVIKYFKERTELLENALNEAKEARVLAERALKEIEQKLKLKDEEIKKIIEAATLAAEADRDKLIAEGKEAAAEIDRLSRENIDYELKKAKDLIRQKAAEAVVELAAEKMRKSVNDNIAGMLISDSISKIGQKMDAIN
ncbi:MAG: ATP synthase F0 subunit B [Nitrospirae bacterium]|nr:ATP synthase F0 subunit B [Nitrospirota bacterium]